MTYKGEFHIGINIYRFIFQVFYCHIHCAWISGQFYDLKEVYTELKDTLWLQQQLNISGC